VILIPILAHKTFKGWPENEVGGVVDYLPLAEALRRRWPTDAHTAQWSNPSVRRRLCAGAPEKLPRGVRMVIVIFDGDAPKGVDVEAWWNVEREKINDLFQDVQGFCYRTRNGYRLIFRLSTPVIIRDEADAEAWANLYRAWCRHLARRYQLAVDVLVDWARLMRLPFVTRDGVAEERESLGDVNPDVWSPVLSAADLVVPVEVAKAPIPVKRDIRSHWSTNEIDEAARKWLTAHGAEPITLDGAADKWNTDHAETWPKRHGLCPICEYKGGFGRAPKKPWLWFCFNTDHPSTAGKPSKTFQRSAFVGDALDVTAFKRGLSRVQVLRKDGYLDDALDEEAKRSNLSRIGVLRRDGYLRRATPAARRPDFSARLDRVTQAARR
jgi:hypothetical protein